ncbi:unnamed protein product, partial [Tilletia caries]
VIGCTGTGKSKLAVELAQHVQRHSSPSSKYADAQIISADSMQVYIGLDALTNKATVEEMGGVQHHLMSFLDAGREYTVKDFTSQAGALIAGMHDDSPQPMLPIVAGGTSYVPHLLFPRPLVSAGAVDDVLKGAKEISPEANEAVEILSDDCKAIWTAFLAREWHKVGERDQPGSTSRELWTLLNALDPLMAAQWHPNDHHKILQSLTVFATTGKRHSDWLRAHQVDAAKQIPGGNEDQEGEEATGSRISKMRRLVFWVWCEPETLGARLDARIHKMIDAGLLDEIRELPSLAEDLCHKGTPDYTRGIFKAIGVKEFDTFLKYMDAHASSSSCTEPGGKLDDEAQRQYDAALELMKHNTRQYAKRQASLIRTQLLPEVKKAREQLGSGDDVEIYLLDATDLEQWGKNVTSVAKEILERFLDRQPLPNPAELNTAAAEHLQKPTLNNSDVSPAPEGCTSKTNRLLSSRKALHPVPALQSHRPDQESNMEGLNL